MSSPPDPADSAARGGRGDAAAVAALLAEHLPGLRAFLRQRMGPRLAAREASQDLVQSVCRELFEHLDDQRFEYRSTAEFRQWLYNAAMFKVQERARFWNAERRSAARELPRLDSTAAAALLGPMWTPSHEASLKENLARLEASLARLPADQQRVVVLARIEGRQHREIAALMGITEGHSRVLLSRALARLARLCDEGR